MTAQSCVYLAELMQVIAGKLSEIPTTSVELTYSPQLDSAVIMRRLLENMLLKYVEISMREDVNVAPVLNIHLAEEIRYMLDRDQAITLEECTISTESPKWRNTETVGDMSLNARERVQDEQ